MRSTIFIALLLLCFCVPATAQMSCSATPAFAVTSTKPAVLTFSHLTTRKLGAPRVKIAGNVITIQQIDFNLPFPPVATEDAASCNNRTINLGTLPSGNYTVRWQYGVPSGVPNGPFGAIESFTFAFALSLETVPALSGPALFGLMLLLASAGMVLLRR